MSGSHWMVVLIVAMAMIASVLRAKYSHRRHRGEIEPQERAENLRLREEVREMKERVKVLERIAVDKENALAREIDSLRDR